MIYTFIFTKLLLACSVYADNFLYAYSAQKYNILNLYPVSHNLFSLQQLTIFPVLCNISSMAWQSEGCPNGGAERQISLYSYTFLIMWIKNSGNFFNLHIVYIRINNYPHIHYMRINNYPHIHYMGIKPTLFLCGKPDIYRK